ncbi:hypothetical protein PHAVU_003G241800 [Phaseolus vulgaris]|uniref:Uncharacterized protein n=1 Tax=Phaseolus vulgaris TaxID=3885 RepID=V7CEU8_PHAVU|nr:hypothetical protein PHAVU_003G241800g [Phaseolus vulgaris]ESW27898.1 hypothetical protein PHAVU_003G241800g [Phaseolus vulgaris]
MWGATGGQKRKVIRGGGEGYFGEEDGILNNNSKRKLFPEKSNPRVREEGHLCLFRSPSDQCPSYAVPCIYDPILHYLTLLKLRVLIIQLQLHFFTPCSTNSQK